MIHTVYLGLGSNLGNREENLRGALFEIASSVGIVEAVSSFMVTEPWGFESTHTFVNAVCRVQTNLSPMELLDATQAIERILGRTKKTVDGVYSDRFIDIDILLYDDLEMDTPRLVIPHPLMAQRDFVKIPLAELGVII